MEFSKTKMTDVSVQPASETEGCFTGFLDGQVLGWAWDPRRPEVALTVDLFADGVPLGSFLANAPDSRLPDIGPHAFSAWCENLEKLRPPFRLRGVIRESRAELSSSLIVGSQAEIDEWLRPFAGRVSSPRGGFVSGSVMRRAAPDETVNVEVTLDDRPFATIAANLSEPADGAARGHGFTVALPTDILDGAVHTLRFRVEGTGYELPGSPVRGGFFAADAVLERLSEVDARLDRIERAGVERGARADAELAVFARALMSRFDALSSIQRDALAYEINLVRKQMGLTDRPAPTVRDRAASTTIVMTEHLDGFGWHGLEQADGRSFRWMPQTAFLVMDFTSTDDATVTASGPLMLDEEHRRGLTILVNGVRALGSVTEEPDGRGWRFNGRVPAAAFWANPFSAVTLRTAFDRRPANSDDGRHLAVAVSEVTLSRVADR